MVIPVWIAARIFSFTPPIGSTRPRSEIPLVIAVSLRILLPVRSDVSARNIATPALAPSLARSALRRQPTNPALGENIPDTRRKARPWRAFATMTVPDHRDETVLVFTSTFSAFPTDRNLPNYMVLFRPTHQDQEIVCLSP